ncbi:thiol reductant ABC exporter subunit CydD [Flexibacterium corallicola]|uniref:thiol reductant ABC exporter subunit CydD n=1 Tax=Flexibacterium corallicola TaxID=3037259 RepID=UPI00286EFE4E|nr:thiol reductant ABC exporter subunit CydD [Pseudovibrio sp. M1P-2-3]
MTESVDTAEVSKGDQKKAKKRRRQKTAGQIWLETTIKPYMGQVKRGAYLLGASELLWIPQAALIAMAVGALVSVKTGSTLPLPVSPLTATAGVLAIAVLRFFLRKTGNATTRKAANAAERHLQESIVSGLASVSPSHPLPASGKISSILVDHVHALGPYLGRYLPIQARLGLVPLVILIAVACVSWVAALGLLILGPLVPVFMAVVGISAKRASDRQLTILSDMSAVLLDRLKNLETLRIFGALEQTEEQLGTIGQTFRRSTMKVLRIAFLSSTALELFAALGIALTAIYVGFSLLGYWNFGAYGQHLTIVGGLFILMLVPEYFAPLRLFAQAYHDRAAALAAADQIAALDDVLKDNAKKAGVQDEQQIQSFIPVPASGQFEISGLGFTRNGQVLLRDIDLEFTKPQLVAVHGASGAGKSTLLDILTGFLRETSGCVRYGGYPVTSFEKHIWQKSLAVISQSPQLFHGTLRENLLRAKSNASEEAIVEALHQADAHRIIEKVPAGLEAIVGEDGLGLSLGERRRIALARAFLRSDARLVLADEPTADLDGATALSVIKGLKHMAKTKPVLVVTHDPRVLAASDRCFVLLEGTLQEGGQ